MEKMTNLIAMNFVLDNCELPADVREKCVNMRDSLAKKSATKSKASRENAEKNAKIAEVIAEVLGQVSEPMTVTEIQKSDDRLADFSNQKLSAILRTMVADEVVVKAIAEKPKRTVFSIA